MKKTDQSIEKNVPNHVSFVMLMTDCSFKTHVYANINGKQPTVLHQRLYIPHVHVHADTLGEVLSFVILLQVGPSGR